MAPYKDTWIPQGVIIFAVFFYVRDAEAFCLPDPHQDRQYQKRTE
jgi:hypothetical protein